MLSSWAVGPFLECMGRRRILVRICLKSAARSNQAGHDKLIGYSTFLRMPKSTSVLRDRSWASSMMMAV